ncbi:MAG: hypothetical protein GWN77_03150, partial [Gammaproteobacteria bacterium]|nr:hypothetical protein [Gammaproteobacteria bacterium]
ESYAASSGAITDYETLHHEIEQQITQLERTQKQLTHAITSALETLSAGAPFRFVITLVLWLGAIAGVAIGLGLLLKHKTHTTPMVPPRSQPE